MHFFWQKKQDEPNLKKEHDYFFLLFSLLTALLLWPFLSQLSFSNYFAVAILLLIFASSIYTIGKKNYFAFYTACFFVVAITILQLLNHYYQSSFINLFILSISIPYFIFISVTVFIYILKTCHISFNEFYGAVSSYLLLGFSWGLIYYLLSLINPNAIFITPNAIDPTKGITQYIYYSFITLTSVGYGDIYPIDTMARLLAICEAIFGQIYYVTLIGWLVTNMNNKNKK